VAATDVAARNTAVAAAKPVCDTAELRRSLLQKGWGRGWVDQITDQNGKQYRTSCEHIEGVIKCLTSLGIPNDQICNMVAMVPAIFGLDPDKQIKPVVDYIQSRGVSGSALVRVLELHPKLLTYSPDGKHLRRGKALAEVDVIEQDGKKLANVIYWREGAVFQSAPIAPAKPKDL
jgi:hypothetical protein